MTFTHSLMAQLSPLHLLKHPFYNAWSHGTLTKETLSQYAGQYYSHVSAFPRYLSATHAGASDLATRQMLLENLIDEERGPENHPELWLRFAESMGMSREEVKTLAATPETTALVEIFMRHARSSFEEGLGVLFAYEHQIPEIAQFKMDALTRHYGVTDSRGLQFFAVHRQADVYHTAALSLAMEALTPAQQSRAQAAAQDGARALWNFLDGMDKFRAGTGKSSLNPGSASVQSAPPGFH